MIATKKTSEYDRAVALLRDLRALAKHRGGDTAKSGAPTLRLRRGGRYRP
jgi:hypothetical protein